LVNDYYKRNRNQLNDLLISCSLKLINVFSKIQIGLKQNKMFNFVQQLIANIKIKKSFHKYEIYNVESKTIEYKQKLEKTDKNETNICILNNYDNEKKIVNKVILSNYEVNNHEVSNIKFLSIEIKTKNECYNIKLHTEKFNYYIVGNVFDKHFFTYYLKRNNICYLKDDNFVVKIIDNNVNVKVIELSNKFILIKKDEYFVFPNIPKMQTETVDKIVINENYIKE